MTNDAIQIISFLPSMFWQLMTGWKLPGLNMTPAVFFFGVLSFGLAFKFLMGIINISTTGFSNYQAGKIRASKERTSRNNKHA